MHSIYTKQELKKNLPDLLQRLKDLSIFVMHTSSFGVIVCKALTDEQKTQVESFEEVVKIKSSRLIEQGHTLQNFINN